MIRNMRHCVGNVFLVNMHTPPKVSMLLATSEKKYTNCVFDQGIGDLALRAQPLLPKVMETGISKNKHVPRAVSLAHRISSKNRTQSVSFARSTASSLKTLKDDAGNARLRYAGPQLHKKETSSAILVRKRKT